MTVILSLLVLITVAWIGLSVYDASSDVQVNPNAENYMKPIKGEFDLDVISSITERLTVLPISTKIFHSLEQTSRDLQREGSSVDIDEIENLDTIED